MAQEHRRSVRLVEREHGIGDEPLHLEPCDTVLPAFDRLLARRAPLDTASQPLATAPPREPTHPSALSKHRRRVELRLTRLVHPAPPVQTL